jgi:hypothetical protein
MATVTLVATAGAANANSYATVAEATTYHDMHLYGSDWSNSDTGTKTKALQMATRLLDNWFDWAGVTATDAQALLWPRVGAIAKSGYTLDSDAIQVPIRDATSELARQLIAGDRSADNQTEVQGLKSLTAGSVSLTFQSVASKPIPDAVMALVGPLGAIRGRSGSGGVRMFRA